MNLLQRLIPVPLRSDPVITGLCEALYSPLDQWKEWVDDRARFILIENLPDSWLDFVLRITGWPPMTARSPQQKRAVLNLGVEWWTRAGTRDATEEYVQALTDVTARIYTTEETALYPSPEPEDSLLVPPKPAVHPYNNEHGLFPSDGLGTFLYFVEVPEGSIEEADLRRLLAPVTPHFSECRIIFISP